MGLRTHHTLCRLVLGTDVPNGSRVGHVRHFARAVPSVKARARVTLAITVFVVLVVVLVFNVIAHSIWCPTQTDLRMLHLLHSLRTCSNRRSSLVSLEKYVQINVAYRAVVGH